MSFTLLIPPKLTADKSDIQNVSATLAYIKFLLAKQRGLPNQPQNELTTLKHYPWDLDDSTEKTWCIDWLQKITKSASKILSISYLSPDSNLNTEDFENLISDSSQIISELCGEGASNAKQVCINLWDYNADPVSLYIHEPSFQEADLGSKTWGSSILLSRLISRKTFDFSNYSKYIELGSGTGLCGISLINTLEKESGFSDITITDFLDPLLDSISKSIQANFPSSTNNNNSDTSGLSKNINGNLLVHVEKFDWFSINQLATKVSHLDSSTQGFVTPPTANYLDISSSFSSLATITPSFKQLGIQKNLNSFDLIIASDVLYEVEHALIIPQVVRHLLSKCPSQRTSFIDSLPENSYSDLHNQKFPCGNHKYINQLISLKIPLFLIVAPLRKTHWTEITTFEAKMSDSGFTCICCFDTTINQDLENWCSHLKNSYNFNKNDNNKVNLNFQNIDNIAQNNSTDDQVYRTYFWI
ncbi:Protein-lysine N-methyltransferase EFM2 [Smittium culicis]|uniref:Protein-lysine N-methyltransferase EFM2 n=1 Tax=Smittium culicis TaxID=133412 RepID=A0A1R1X669_9FUNG|nr:Protein-lysine N-methyltransferase EFM2 [Smittium culicis]OMJ26014.1 Protein-lysine N-methyltransferase EFM2 [Smittium culicis]